MNFNVLWETHKQFVIKVVAGFAVYLILQYLAAGYQSQAAETIDKSRNLAASNDESVKRLDYKHDRETKAHKVLDARLEDFLSKVSITQTSVVKMPSGDPEIDFPKKMAAVWDKFTDQAKRRNIGHPRANDVSFGLRSGMSDQEWDDQFVLLEVIRRVVTAAEQLRVHSVISVKPMAVETAEIPGIKGVVRLAYPVQFEIEATYEVTRDLLANFERESEYLAVSVDLEPVQVEGDEKREGNVRGIYTFAGIDLGEPREKSKGRKSGFRQGGTRKR